MNVETWQAQQEQKIREIKTLLDSGAITQGEYEELAQDVFDIAGIEENLELEENKIRVQKAVEALKVVAGLL